MANISPPGKNCDKHSSLSEVTKKKNRFMKFPPEEVLEGEDAVDGDVGRPVQGRVRVDAQPSAFLPADGIKRFYFVVEAAAK
jgi:hypothetical protein